MKIRAAGPVAGMLLAAILSTPSPAASQRADDGPALDPSHTRGFFVNVRSGGYGIGFEDDRDGTGGGFGLRLGYGLSERTTLFAGVEGGTISDGDGFEGLPRGDDYGLLYMDLGARVHFRTDRRLVPFVEGSVNLVALWFDDEQDEQALYGGPSASLGGGLLWFLSPAVALEGAALFSAGSLMESEVGGVSQEADLGLAGIRLQVGLSLYPGG
jgi:hypothetical protein